MNVKEIQDKKIWNDFIEKHSGSPSVFLQSWEWGEYQETLGRSVERLGVAEDGELVGVAQCVRMPLPLGRSWMYSPRGPVVRHGADHKHIYEMLRDAVGAYDKVVWWRVEPAGPPLDPPLEKGGKVEKCEMGFRQPAVLGSFTQPRSTLLVDVAVGEEELLARMKSKTRYNIRLAERKGVKIVSATKIDDFYRLMQETGKRDGISVYPREWYEQLFSMAGKSGMKSEMVRAEYEGVVIAASILVHFGDTTTYLHGASGNNHRTVMAPHLVQWESMQRAREQGSRWYDFWGAVAPGRAVSEKDASWAGISRFKYGFVSLEEGHATGKEVMYGGACDFVYSQVLYQAYRVGGIFR